MLELNLNFYVLTEFVNFWSVLKIFESILLMNLSWVFHEEQHYRKIFLHITYL